VGGPLGGFGARAAVGAVLLAVASAGVWASGGFVGIGAVDHHGTLWTHATFARALATGDPDLLLGARDFFHPYGQDWLANTGGNLLDALLAWPLGGLGRVAGHNAALLLVLLANGLAAAHAASRLGGRPWPALVAGLFSSWPLYELVEGRPAQALLAPAFLALSAVAEVGRGTGAPWRAGAWLALVGVGYWYHGLCATLAAAVWLVGVRAPWRRVLVVLGTAGALVAPLVLPLLFAGAPSSAGMILHHFDPAAWKVAMVDGDRVLYTQRGLPWALVGVGVWAALRPGRAWIAPALLLFVLACGPTVRLGEQALPNPLWEAVAWTPPFARWAHPARALGMLAVLGAVGLSLLPRVGAWGITAALVAEASWAGLLPLPAWSAEVPPAYACLAAPGEGAVVELPWPPPPRTLGWQPVHRRPLLGGMWNLEPRFQREEAATLLAEPGVAGLLDRSRTGVGDASFDALAAQGYRWVVLVREALPAPVDAPRRALRRRIELGLREVLGEPLYEDEQTTVWAPLGDPLPCGEITAPATTPLVPVRDRRVLDLGPSPAAEGPASRPDPGAARPG